MVSGVWHAGIWWFILVCYTPRGIESPECLHDSIKASWSRTQGHLLKILFWSIGGAFVFTAVGLLIGLLTSSLPSAIAGSIGTGVGLVFTYASGSVLYRRITAK